MQGSPGAASCRTAVLHTRRETLSNTLTSPPPEESHPKMETQVAGSYRKAHPAGVRAACGLGQRRRAGGPALCTAQVSGSRPRLLLSSLRPVMLSLDGMRRRRA